MSEISFNDSSRHFHAGSRRVWYY